MESYTIQITNYLLAQSWQIAVLVVVVAAVTLLLKNKSAHVRYLLWVIVLAKCLVPPLLTVPLPILPEQRAVIVLPPTEPIAAERVEAPAADAPVPSAPSAPAITKHEPAFTIHQYLAVGWIVGAGVFILVAVVKALRTEFWLRRERKPLPAELGREIKELFSGLGVRISPKLWLVEGIGQPFVWGLLRGGIYLPAGFVKTDNAEYRKSVIGHELSHVLRFDAAVNLLQVMAQAAFWFHPFVWWANKRIRAEREKCCDEMTIARLGARVKDYSSAIVSILITEQESTRPIPSLAIAGPVRNIEERIKTMLRPGKRFHKRPSLMTTTVILLFALLTVPTVLVLTTRAGTNGEEVHRIAEGAHDRGAAIPKPSELSTKVTCIGKVLSVQGQPIAGAKVTAYEMLSDGIAGNILLRQVGEVTTVEDGAFTFATVQKPERGVFFECKIVALKNGLAMGWAEWSMREDIERTIRLGKPERFEGMIVDDAGKPIIDAEVRASLYRTVGSAEGEEKREWLPGIPPFGELVTRTNGQGRFLFSNLPAGSGVDILAIAAGKATTYTYQSELSKPAFKAGQKDIKVILPDEARIEGRIVDPDTGKGVARTKFAVVFTGSGLYFYRFVCTTDDNGAFGIGGLQNSEYVIRGRKRNSLLPTYVNAKSGQTKRVTVGANKLYYGRVLFEYGGPVVIKPEPWPGAKTRIQVEGKGEIRNIIVGDLDDEGYFEIYLSQEQYQQLQSGKAYFGVSIPYIGKRTYFEEVSARDLLATDKAKAGVARVARRESKPHNK